MFVHSTCRSEVGRIETCCQQCTALACRPMPGIGAAHVSGREPQPSSAWWAPTESKVRRVYPRFSSQGFQGDFWFLFGCSQGCNYKPKPKYFKLNKDNMNHEFNMFLVRAVLISPLMLFCTFSETKYGPMTTATVFRGFFPKILATRSQQSFRSVPVTFPYLVKSSQTTVPAQDSCSAKSLMNWQGHGKTQVLNLKQILSTHWEEISGDSNGQYVTICLNGFLLFYRNVRGITICGNRFGHQMQMFMMSEVGRFEHLQQVVSYSSVSVDCSVCVAFLHMLQDITR